MELVKKHFNDLTALELYKILQLRMQVFMIEQNNLYDELDYDDDDLVASHLFYKKNDDIIAYTRVMFNENKSTFCRVCVNKNYRGQNLGKKIVNETIKYIFIEHNRKEIIINSQEDKKDFYTIFGFKKISDIYIDDNLPHIDMLLHKKDYRGTTL